MLASLLVMRVRPIAKPVSDLGIFEGLSEGFEYVTGSMPIRTLLVLLGIVSMMSAPLTVLMPILATEVLHGGPETLGLLTAALGVGALVASLFLAARKSVVGLGTVIAVATGVFGLGMAGLSFSHTLWICLVLLLVTGFAMVAQMAASNAVLQTIVEENKRGRVMSFYTMAFFGMGPLGSLLAGCLASTLGTAATFLIFGMVAWPVRWSSRPCCPDCEGRCAPSTSGSASCRTRPPRFRWRKPPRPWPMPMQPSSPSISVARRSAA